MIRARLGSSWKTAAIEGIFALAESRPAEGTPRPTLKGIQQVIDSGMSGKKLDLKAEKLLDLSIVDELEKSGFMDAVYKDR